MTLSVGTKLPSFTAQTDKGETIESSSLLGEGPVVFFFYPKNNTPVCTKEACAFRDAYDAFRDHGAKVVGISGDSQGSHQKFREKHKLPFILLSDKGKALRKIFEVKATLGILPGRETFVVDADGVVQHAFSGQRLHQEHVDEALEVVKKLTQAP